MEENGSVNSYLGNFNIFHSYKVRVGISPIIYYEWDDMYFPAMQRKMWIQTVGRTFDVLKMTNCMYALSSLPKQDLALFTFDKALDLLKQNYRVGNRDLDLARKTVERLRVFVYEIGAPDEPQEYVHHARGEDIDEELVEQREPLRFDLMEAHSLWKRTWRDAVREVEGTRIVVILDDEPFIWPTESSSPQPASQPSTSREVDRSSSSRPGTSLTASQPSTSQQNSSRPGTSLTASQSSTSQTSSNNTLFVFQARDPRQLSVNYNPELQGAVSITPVTRPAPPAAARPAAAARPPARPAPPAAARPAAARPARVARPAPPARPAAAHPPARPAAAHPPARPAAAHPPAHPAPPAAARPAAARPARAARPAAARPAAAHPAARPAPFLRNINYRNSMNIHSVTHAISGSYTRRYAPNKISLRELNRSAPIILDRIGNNLVSANNLMSIRCLAESKPVPLHHIRGIIGSRGYHYEYSFYFLYDELANTSRVQVARLFLSVAKCLVQDLLGHNRNDRPTCSEANFDGFIPANVMDEFEIVERMALGGMRLRQRRIPFEELFTENSIASKFSLCRYISPLLE
jgi:hypothetical protein